MTAIGLLPLFAIASSLLIDATYIISLFVPTCLLMASAAIFVGGQGVTPPHLMLLSLLICLCRQNSANSTVKHVLFGTKAGLSLCGVAIYGSFLAFFYPRLYPGSTHVNTFASEVPLSFLNPPPLEPTSSNVTQSIYIIGSFFTFVAVLTLCRSAARYRALMLACLATVVINIAFACVDLATYYTGTAFVMDFIHNGNYVIRTNETAVLGLKRISGSFTETSAFSGTTLGLFGFTLRLWLRQVRTGLMLVLTLLQAGLLLLSTSSTGLGGLLVVLVGCWIVSAWRLVRSQTRLLEAWFCVLFPLFMGALVLWILAYDPLRELMSGVVEDVFLNKSQSESGVERLMLNAQAITNFIDSSGIGLGFGSVRSSSFLLALIASVGVPGAALFLIFFVALFFSKPPSGLTPAYSAAQDACRMACFGLLTAACIASTSMDLSLLFFVFAAGAYWAQTCAFNPLGVKERRELNQHLSPPSTYRQVRGVLSATNGQDA